MKKHYTIPVFIPELACPFQCIYCNQHIISGEDLLPTPTEIIETIELHLATFKADAHVELGFFGGNFTGIPVKEQEDLLALVQPYILNNKIQSIRLSTRPDYISEEILQMLKKYNVKTIELGVQSLDETVLSLTKRGYLPKTVERASALIKTNGFDLGLQMMIGLPGDTKEKSAQTAQKIVDLGASCTRIYPTVVLKQTKLAEMYLKGEYEALSMQKAIEWTKEPLDIFERNNVTVLRVGLHPTEGFIKGEDYLAGPFHVSFKELVLSELWKDKLIDCCKNDFDKGKSVIIYVSAADINYAIGYQSKNRIFLKQHFKNVIFKSSSEIKNREFKVEILSNK